MNESRRISLIVGVLTIAASIGLCFWKARRLRNSPRGVITAPSITRSRDGVEIFTRRAQIEPQEGGFWMNWGAYVRNTGQGAVTSLALRVIGRADNGVEIGRDEIDVIGVRERLAWLPPGYGILVVPSGHSLLAIPPNSIEVVVTALRRADDHEAGPWTPLEVTWPAPLPARIAFEFRKRGCDSRATGVGPSAGRVVFECTVGVRNVGTRAIDPPSLTFHFITPEGEESDSPIGAEHDVGLPLQPGDALIYRASRGVRAFRTYRVDARLPQ